MCCSVCSGLQNEIRTGKVNMGEPKGLVWEEGYLTPRILFRSCSNTARQATFQSDRPVKRRHKTRHVVYPEYLGCWIPLLENQSVVNLKFFGFDATEHHRKNMLNFVEF